MRSKYEDAIKAVNTLEPNVLADRTTFRAAQAAFAAASAAGNANDIAAAGRAERVAQLKLMATYKLYLDAYEKINQYGKPLAEFCIKTGVTFPDLLEKPNQLKFNDVWRP